MFIKCSYCDGVDNVLIHLPETEKFEFRYRYDDGLYLILPDREIMLRDMDYWCQGRLELPTYAVGDLYSEIVDTIAEMLINNEKISVVNIDRVEEKLVSEKYEKEWVSKEYISTSKDGSW